MDKDLHDVVVEQTRQNESLKSAHKRIDESQADLKETNENVQEIALGVKEIAYETREMRKEVNNIQGVVDEIEKAPVKRYNGIIDKIIMVMVGAIVSYAFTQIGM